MKWNTELFKVKRLTTKKVKEQGTGFLFLGFILLGMFLLICIGNYYWSDKVIRIPVRSLADSKVSEKAVEFDFGHFSTGSEGTLAYNASSLLDFVLLQKVGYLNLVDFIYLCIIGILIHNSTSKIKPSKAFSQRRTNIFRYISYLTMSMYVIKKIFNDVIVRSYLLNKTTHMFYLREDDSNLYYMIFGGILLIYVYFIEQGNELQKEQELTI
jgi:hypothetical protein